MMPRRIANPSRPARFTGRSAEAEALQVFANGLRAALGLCPLYGADPETDYRVEMPEPTSPRRPMRIGITGVHETRPHEPHVSKDLASAIDRQIRRDRYYARARVNLSERQDDE